MNAAILSRPADPASLRREIEALEREIEAAKRKRAGIDNAVTDRTSKLARLKSLLALCDVGSALPAMACSS